MTEYGAPGNGIGRREFLAATGATGTAALAGCLGDERESASTASPAGDDDLPITAAPQVVDLDDQDGQVTLSTRPARQFAHPGDSMGGPVELPRVWAFQADDRPPSVPGPVLRATEGQTLEIALDNSDAAHPHTLHFHGVRKSWENDGVPTTTGIRVDPGDTHTYEIPANVPGTHLYHCHYQTHRHVDMGMYGVFRVDPDGYEPADTEAFLTIKEWDSRLNRKMAGEDASYSPRQRTPDTFTVNGRSAPRTLHPEDGSPVIVEHGDTVRLHFVNAGYHNHPMHTHNHRFQVVEKDGATVPEAARHDQDIVDVAPAQRRTVEFEADADPGAYLLHCHKVNHAMNGTFYPGGMVTGLLYEEVMDTDVVGNLLSAAGYEG
jgi:FtsP/CotA-like multicopper oxidase with cupredoxin domain